MRKTVSDYFLGANSRYGFFSLYDELKSDPDSFLYVIKGSPGSGKSTFLKKIANAAEEAGAEVERIHCSSDPYSLDAVIIPDLHLIYADGTYPHIVEPVLPGLRGAYLSLLPEGKNINLFLLREELQKWNSLYQAEYRKAYQILGAVGALLPEFSPEDTILSTVRAEAGKRISRDGQKGSCKEIFLGSVCHSGLFPFFPSCKLPCEDIEAIVGDTSFLFMDECLQEAQQNHLDCIVCRNSIDPRRIDGILFPGGNGFVRKELTKTGNIQPIRLLSLPDICETDTLTQQKNLLDEAVSHLKKAKEYHDELENTYRPTLDFSECDRKARTHIREIKRLLERNL